MWTVRAKYVFDPENQQRPGEDLSGHRAGAQEQGENQVHGQIGGICTDVVPKSQSRK
jgi:hypothetical protein